MDGPRFRVLGPLTVIGTDDLPVALGGPKPRRLLTALLLARGEPVAVTTLIRAVWAETPPASAVANLHSYVSELRRRLPAPPDGGPRLERGPGGYRIVLAAGELDVTAFDTLVEQARRATDPAIAAERLGAALRLWRDPLPDPDGAGLVGPLHRLIERRWTAVEDLNEARLTLGQHRDLAEALRGLTREQPLRERLWEQLLLALDGAGRRAAALAAYREAYRLFTDELGVPPGARLQELHRKLLAGEPPDPAPIVGDPPRRRPAQLPADVPGFTGRQAELAALDRMFDTGAAAPAVALVTGTAGVGKTGLVVRWAHRAAAEFPDGQLHLDLRGYDPAQPVDAGAGLARFLRAFGVPDEEIPLDLTERAARYRTEVAGRRLLVVLDNASSVDQVRPLLPGTATAAVLVTSRNALAGLVARDGARRLELDLLPADDAVTLLGTLIGTRVDAEPAAARQLADQCARLPLALRVAAELAVRRDRPLARLVAELADEQRRLDLFDAVDDPRVAVTAVFSWSLAHLPADALALFRLLGLPPGPTVDAPAAAALVDGPTAGVEAALDTLARAHLVQRVGDGRYGMHDLLRAYAAQSAARDEPAGRRSAALTRLFDHYAAAATVAMDVWYPAERHRRPRPPVRAREEPAPADPAAALAWLDEQRPVLVSACGYAAEHGWPDHAVHLAATLFRYLYTGGYSLDALAAHEAARAAAVAGGDRIAEARALADLGTTYLTQGRYDTAESLLERAVALFGAAGEPSGLARAEVNLGVVRWYQGRYEAGAEPLAHALELFRGAADDSGQARALSNLGNIRWRQGRYAEAAEQHGRALELYERVGDRHGAAFALVGLGEVHCGQGRYERATDELERALRLHREVGDRTGEAYAMVGLGQVSARQGRHAEAEDRYRAALRRFHRIGERPLRALALNGLGEILYASGYPAAAVDQHRTALAVTADGSLRYEEARAHRGLARALDALGDAAAAREHHRRAEAQTPT